MEEAYGHDIVTSIHINVKPAIVLLLHLRRKSGTWRLAGQIEDWAKNRADERKGKTQ